MQTTLKTFLFPYARYAINSLAVWQNPAKRIIYKKLFKFLQKVTGRTRKFNCEFVEWKVAAEREVGDVLTAIKQDGYCLLSPGYYENRPITHQQAVTRASNLLSLYKKDITGSRTKDYLHRMSNVPVEEMNFFYNYFTNPFYLNLAACYLKDEPILTEIKLLVSPVKSGCDSRPQGSQLFHSDFDDEANLKIFVFLDEIDEFSGPLQAVNRAKSKELMNASNYRWGKEGVSHNDSIVASDDTSYIRTFVGKTGSVCLIDTVACLHRGSRFPTRERKILYATFNTRTSFRFPPLNWIGLAPRINNLSSPLLSLDPERHFIGRFGLNI
jgi:hypothetical protein